MNAGAVHQGSGGAVGTGMLPAAVAALPGIGTAGADGADAPAGSGTLDGIGRVGGGNGTVGR